MEFLSQSWIGRGVKPTVQSFGDRIFASVCEDLEVGGSYTIVELEHLDKRI